MNETKTYTTMADIEADMADMAEYERRLANAAKTLAATVEDHLHQAGFADARCAGNFRIAPHSPSFPTISIEFRGILNAVVVKPESIGSPNIVDKITRMFSEWINEHSQ
jgi:hypothetical protein